jgi:hypothetical protein
MCIATQRKRNNDPLAIMALRDTQLLTGQCVKTGRIQKLRLNFLVAEAASSLFAHMSFFATGLKRSLCNFKPIKD